MTILEAWSYRLPVIMTEECNLPEAKQLNASLIAETNSESVLQSIQQLISASVEDRRKIGENGFELVKIRYTWEQVSSQLNKLYHWVNGQSPKPEFVLEYDGLNE